MATRLTNVIVAFIVSATLIAGLIVRAQRDDIDGPVDVIIFNGRVYPANGRGFQEAVAVRGNRVLRVGSNREIKRLRRAQTIVLDAHGGAVMPGFNDAHVHLMRAALSLQNLDLDGANTLSEVEERIRLFAEQHPGNDWIHGEGWHPEAFLGSAPHKNVLDALLPDRPAYILGNDGRTAWANSKALDLAGINRRTARRHKGVVRDSKTGEPTGLLKAPAQKLVEHLLPPPSHDDLLEAIRAAVETAHRSGITSVQDAGSTAEDLALYDEVRKSGDLLLRVYSSLPAGAGLTDADADRLGEIRSRYPDDPVLKAGAVKLAVAVTATPPVAEDARSNTSAEAADEGAGSFTEAELTRLVTMFDRREWQVIVHVSDSEGTRLAVKAFETAVTSSPDPKRTRRHRLEVEDVSLIDTADVPRLADLGIIVSEQSEEPAPSPASAEIAPSLFPGVDAAPPAAPPSAQLTDIADAGIRLTFGSDWPAGPIDPRYALRAAPRSDSNSEPGSTAGNALPLTAAVDAYTSGAAYASFDEQRKGTLAPGMLADIVIMSADIFELPPERLLDGVIDVTIFDGKVVYQRETTTETR